MMTHNLTRAQNGFSGLNHRRAVVRTWRSAAVLALVTVLTVVGVLLPARSAFAQQRIFVPLVANTQRDAQPQPQPESDPQPQPRRNVIGSGEQQYPCSLSGEEEAAANLIAAHSEQRRGQMFCDARLAEVARARAKDMAEREYFGHINPDGNGPNWLVTQAGYELPNWYSDRRDANNIESIAAGFATAQDVVQGWEGSDGHRNHLLGLNDFYKDQEAFGIGHYYDPDSPYLHYWVFLSAHAEGVTVTSVTTTLPEMPEGIP